MVHFSCDSWLCRWRTYPGGARTVPGHQGPCPRSPPPHLCCSLRLQVCPAAIRPALSGPFVATLPTLWGICCHSREGDYHFLPFEKVSLSFPDTNPLSFSPTLIASHSY